MHTEQGLLVTATDITEIEAVNHFHHQVMSAGLQADAILNAAQTFPDNPLIQTYAAVFYLFAQEDSASQVAKSYLNQAKLRLSSANEREKLLFYAVEAWYDKHFEAAITLFSTIVTLYPKDTLALKFAEWLFYCTGQAYNGRRYLKLCYQATKENQADPYFLACLSFAYELSGFYDKAYAQAEQAMTIEPILPWAHHTIAHVLLMTQNIDKSIQFLQQVRPSWDGVMPLLKGHNSWHLALGYVANLEGEKALKILENDLWGNDINLIGTQLDMVSLLWRLDMAGLPQDKKYNELLSHLQQHPYEQHTGFNSLHFIYALARAGQYNNVSKALKAIQNFIDQHPNSYQQVYWQHIALPFCQAAASFAQHDHITVLTRLTPIIEQCYQLGGSDAQCDLFLQMYFISLIHCRPKSEAKRFYHQYLSHYNQTALEAYWWS